MVFEPTDAHLHRREVPEFPDLGDLLGTDLFPAGPPVPSNAEIEGGRLVWSGLNAQTSSTSGALDAFVKIDAGDEEGVVRFARRFGTLHLCEHNLPFMHKQGCEPGQAEALETWYYHAERARALLNWAAANAHDPPRPGTYTDHVAAIGRWPLGGAIVELVTAAGSERGWSEVARDQLMLRLLINQWLELGGVRPALDPFPGASATIFLSSTTAYGLIGTQLATAISRAREIWTCTMCGFPYFRGSRKPNSGQRNICGREVCRRAAARERKRDSRGPRSDVSPGVS